ncbi:hypothetical protein Hanom_Chr15g01413271 [Helianthus anomalus]
MGICVFVRGEWMVDWSSNGLLLVCGVYPWVFLVATGMGGYWVCLMDVGLGFLFNKFSSHENIKTICLNLQA